MPTKKRHFIGESDVTRIYPCGKPRNRGTSWSVDRDLVTCSGCLATLPKKPKGFRWVKRPPNDIEQRVAKLEHQLGLLLQFLGIVED